MILKPHEDQLWFGIGTMTLIDLSTSLLGCAFLGNSPGIPWNSGNGLLRFGEFAGTWFLFLQESILNAVQAVQERPKTHSFFTLSFGLASTSFSTQKNVDEYK